MLQIGRATVGLKINVANAPERWARAERPAVMLWYHIAGYKYSFRGSDMP